MPRRYTDSSMDTATRPRPDLMPSPHWRCGPSRRPLSGPALSGPSRPLAAHREQLQVRRYTPTPLAFPTGRRRSQTSRTGCPPASEACNKRTTEANQTPYTINHTPYTINRTLREPGQRRGQARPGGPGREVLKPGGGGPGGQDQEDQEDKRNERRRQEAEKDSSGGLEGHGGGGEGGGGGRCGSDLGWALGAGAWALGAGAGTDIPGRRRCWRRAGPRGAAVSGPAR